MCNANSESTKFVLHAASIKLPLGHVVITESAIRKIGHRDVLLALARHEVGDWGEIDDEVHQLNELSLRRGRQLYSRYFSQRELEFWVITKSDRSQTIVLLPGDY